MASFEDVSVDFLKEMLSYNPETGEIYWIKSPAKNVYAGELAGCTKATRKTKSGSFASYSYIRLNGLEIPSARIAWALYHGKWPNGRVTFKDKNSLNLSIENLSLNKSLFNNGVKPSLDVNSPEYYKEHRKVHRLDYSEQHLKRKYGITIADYSQMFLKQNGKCAICGGEDGGTRHGNPKALAVDHDHKTGKIRGLLCEACNQGIGKLKEDVEILQNAIRYLTTN